MTWFLTLVRLVGGRSTVGFVQVTIPDDPRPPLAAGVWYPSDTAETDQQIGPFRQRVATNGRLVGAALPLVLISHGTSGSLASHYDTAVALARAGFVVAAVTHTGDNYRDQADCGYVRGLTDRPRQMKRLLDFMAGEWPMRERLDQSRVGVRIAWWLHGARSGRRDSAPRGAAGALRVGA
jgi:predicted dienelactone hydrolase